MFGWILVAAMVVTFIYIVFDPAPYTMRLMKEGRSSNDLLKKSKIPRPEFLMVNMLALRIAALPHADGSFELEYTHTFELSLSTGSCVVIRYYLMNPTDGIVDVSIRSNDTTTDCILMEQEKKILIEAFSALYVRTQRVNMERAAQKSSDASLEALAAMFAPVE